MVNSVEGPPKFPKPDFNLSRLLEFANVLVAEQTRVEKMRLVREYNQSLNFHEQQHQVASQPIQTETPSNGNGYGSNGQAKKAQLNPEIMQQLQQLVSSGYRIGIEYVDERRFRTNSWISCASIAAFQEGEAIAALENCLAEHGDEYIRLVGIDPNAKRRVMETIIHRPR